MLEGNGKLAIFMTQLRSVSETFIRRHVEGLAPGRTVAVAQLLGLQGPMDQPAFVVDRWQLRVPVRVAIRAGMARERLLDGSLSRFLQRHRVQTVLIEYMDQFVDFVPLLGRLGLPYVVQAHGLDVSSSLRDAALVDRYQVYRSARAILTRSEFHRRRLIDLGLPEALIHVNPGGVDVPAQVPRRDAGASKRFLAVGRMISKKAPIVLLEAFRQAASQDPDITLDYVGGGPLFPAVLQFVRACGLENRVRLHRHAPDKVKMRLLAECGVFAQHSATDPETGDEESLPASIQEAMANGLAVVSTRHAGIPEAVRDGETGLLVDEWDAEAMAAAFVQVPRNAVAFGAAGYRVAASKYSWHDEKARLQGWLGLSS